MNRFSIQQWKMLDMATKEHVFSAYRFDAIMFLRADVYNIHIYRNLRKEWSAIFVLAQFLEEILGPKSTLKCPTTALVELHDMFMC